MTLVYLAIGFILEYLSMKVTGEDSRLMEMLKAAAEGYYYYPAGPDTSLLADFISAALSIMSMMVGVGFTIYTLNVSRRVSAGYGNLLDGFAIFFKALWLHIPCLFRIPVSLLFIIPHCQAYRYRQAHTFCWSIPTCRPGRIRQARG